MSAAPAFLQLAGHVLDISAWDLDEDYPINPKGQKAKKHLLCPPSPPHHYLVGGRRYMFKTPSGRSEQQIWSEVIAYHLAQYVGVSVPPAYVAINYHGDLNCGVLIEFFLGPTYLDDGRLVHASDRFQAWGMLFDQKRGSLRDNIKLTRGHAVSAGTDWWARTVAFDALIGNTDRHSENWGFLTRWSLGGPLTYEMAPVFDNGSSLGSVVREADLKLHMETGRFDTFIARGRHHFNWLQVDDGSGQFARLAGHFARTFPSSRPAMLEVASVSDAQIDAIMSWCTAFRYPISFSQTRAEFVCRLLKARRKALLEAIGG